MPEQSVTAVVVNYRSGNHLRSCLKALLSDRNHLAKVIVIDNASGDSSWEVADRLIRDDSRVELVLSDRNLGLAGAVNRVLSAIDSPYMAILNPDVTPHDDWLSPLVGVLQEHPNVGVACPLVLIDGGLEVNSAGQQVHVTGLGFNRHLHSDPSSVQQGSHEVGGLHGAAFVIRTASLRFLGGWDQTGFLYHEDVALSWDILLSGLRILCVPSSQVTHDYHLTMYPEKLYLLERNRWALLLSHLRVGRLLAISPALLVTELMVWGLALTRGPSFLSAKWRSLVWILRQRAVISAWRHRVFGRSVYDAEMLYRNTRWAYPLRQLGVLGVERGSSSRVPPGGLPV